MSTATLPERRQSKRVVNRYPAELMVLTGEHAGNDLKAEVVDISRHGVGIEMSQKFSEGDQVGFVIYVDGYESLCVGNVVWGRMQENTMRYGFRISRWSYIDPTLETQL